MANEVPAQQQVSIAAQAVPLSVNPGQNILDQTLGDLLQNNPQAQQMITQSMGITQGKFQEMLTTAQQNNLMHMKISDLFKNGIVQQAQSVVLQGQPAQSSIGTQNTPSSDKVMYTLPQNPQKKPWWKSLLGF